MQLTLIDSGRPSRPATVVDAHSVDGGVAIPNSELERATGVARKPEGFCIGDVCFPVRESIDVTVDGEPAVDLAATAAAMHRPVVIDTAAGVAVLGASDAERADALKAGTAPDFTLPGIDGRTYSMSEFRGRKRVLYAYASW
jgi:hypothetical protein